MDKYMSIIQQIFFFKCKQYLTRYIILKILHFQEMRNLQQQKNGKQKTLSKSFSMDKKASKCVTQIIQKHKILKNLQLANWQQQEFYHKRQKIQHRLSIVVQQSALEQQRKGLLTLEKIQNYNYEVEQIQLQIEEKYQEQKFNISMLCLEEEIKEFQKNQKDQRQKLQQDQKIKKQNFDQSLNIKRKNIQKTNMQLDRSLQLKKQKLEDWYFKNALQIKKQKQILDLKVLQLTQELENKQEFLNGKYALKKININRSYKQIFLESKVKRLNKKEIKQEKISQDEDTWLLRCFQNDYEKDSSIVVSDNESRSQLFQSFINRLKFSAVQQNHPQNYEI